MRIGYTRVSTVHQSHDPQRDVLLADGIEPDHIYSDTVSGMVPGAKRPGLSRVMTMAREGDELVVWRIDRLGRSVADVFDVVETLLDRGVRIRSVTDGIDPSTPAGRLILGIMASLAQYERELIRERIQAGVDAARARGTRIGKPPPDARTVASKVRLARKAMTEDGETASVAAKLVGLGRSTLYRYMRAVDLAESEGLDLAEVLSGESAATGAKRTSKYAKPSK